MRRRLPIGALTAGVAVVATAFALVVSCGSDSPVAAPPSTVPPAVAPPAAEVAGATELRPLVPAELEARLRSAVLEVRSSGCGFDRQGTVSLVDLGGGPTAITNRHVVAGAATTQVVRPDGTSVTAPVLGAVRDRDAATLDAAGLDAAAALPAAPTPLVGDEVVVVGFPDGRFSSAAGRVVSVEERVDDGGEVTVLLVDVPAGSGASGGLVVDASGRAVGLVAARDPDTGNAVAYPFPVLAAPLETGLPGC